MPAEKESSGMKHCQPTYEQASRREDSRVPVLLTLVCKTGVLGKERKAGFLPLSGRGNSTYPFGGSDGSQSKKQLSIESDSAVVCCWCPGSGKALKVQSCQIKPRIYL